MENIIKKAFGENFLGIIDKKIFVKANDGGEMIDIAISLTCPKTGFISTNTPANTGLDFETMETPATTASNFQPAQITNEETENIKNMLARLGL